MDPGTIDKGPRFQQVFGRGLMWIRFHLSCSVQSSPGICAFQLLLTRRRSVRRQRWAAMDFELTSCINQCNGHPRLGDLILHM